MCRSTLHAGKGTSRAIQGSRRYGRRRRADDAIRGVRADDAPAPLGAYPHAVVARGLVFCSGQGSRDPATGVVAGLVRDAAGARGRPRHARRGRGLPPERAARAGGARRDARRRRRAAGVPVDMGDFDGLDEVYARCFPGGGPARTTMGVASPAGRELHRDRGPSRVAPDGKEVGAMTVEPREVMRGLEAFGLQGVDREEPPPHDPADLQRDDLQGQRHLHRDGLERPEHPQGLPLQRERGALPPARGRHRDRPRTSTASTAPRRCARASSS